MAFVKLVAWPFVSFVAYTTKIFGDFNRCVIYWAVHICIHSFKGLAVAGFEPACRVFLTPSQFSASSTAIIGFDAHGLLRHTAINHVVNWCICLDSNQNHAL